MKLQTKVRRALAKGWRWINGKKIAIGVAGFAIEAASYLVDKPEIVQQLPAGSQGAVNGALAVMTILGVLHKAEKKDIAAEK